MVSKQKDEDVLEQGRCPRCGKDLVKEPFCPHTMEFSDYFDDVCFTVEDHLGPGYPVWIHISAWVNRLTERFEDARGMEYDHEIDADVIIEEVVAGLPEHLRPIFDGDPFRWDTNRALSEYVWSLIVRSPGYIGVVRYETDSPASSEVIIPLDEDPKAAMRELDAQLLPDIEALKRAAHHLEALMKNLEGD